MTYRECAIVQAFTGVCMLTEDKTGHFYQYVEEIMGKPIFTHELPMYADEIKEKSREDFINLCKAAVDEKEVV